MRKALSTVLYVLLVLPGLAACSTAAMTSDGPPAEAIIDDPWPRQLVSGGNTFSVFQPQYERWEQGRLEGRAAVSMRPRPSPCTASSGSRPAPRPTRTLAWSRWRT
jgi:hypothetical protein